MTQTILVLGARGRFGHNIAEVFEKAGWTVRKFDRAHDDLDSAASGADVIAMGWNPPYHHWADQLSGLHAEVRRVALRHDATVILPGNVYVFGPGTGPAWDADTPHQAQNPLGRLRVEMEESYRREGVRTILVRAGDYLDTQASGNWFDRVIAKGVWKGRISYPGGMDVPHAWGYLPDMARACLMLTERRESLPRFSDVPFAGFTLTGIQMAQALSEVTGHPVRARRMAWWPLRMMRPVMPFIGGMIEMRYLWDIPHHLDGAKMVELLPDFEPTPLRTALAAAIAPLR